MEKIINRLIELPEINKTYLEILKIHQREVPLANLLAFFFRPNEKHNLENLFIETLLNTNCSSLTKVNNTPLSKVFSNSYLNKTKTKLDYSKIENVKVRTEVKVNDDKRIDILIEAETFVICIEFKINHNLDNPLLSYQTFIETEEDYINKKHIFLVLTPYRKEAIGDAIVYLEKGNLKFQQVILSHFFKSINIKEDTKNKFKEYFNDLIQTIKNREIRYKRSELIKQIANKISIGFNSEFINNSEGGYLQYKINDIYIKLRVSKSHYRIDKCNSNFKVIEQKKIEFSLNIKDLETEIKTLGNTIYSS
jgi:hypothetical protein